MTASPTDLLRDPAAFLQAEGFAQAAPVTLADGTVAWRAEATRLWALENCVIRTRQRVHDAGGVLLVFFGESATGDQLWLFPDRRPVDLFPALRAVGYLEGRPPACIEATEALYGEVCAEKPCLTPTRLAAGFVNLRCLDGQISKALARRALDFSCAVHGYQVDAEVFDGPEAEAHYWATKGSLILGG